MRKNKKISYGNLIIIIVAIVLLIIIGITVTMARYRSTGNTSVSAEVAFFVLNDGIQSGDIMLDNLYPREDPFEYAFTISNTEGTKIAETSIDYEIELRFTTNLPLEIEVYKNESKLTNSNYIENNIVLDESGQCYIRKIKIKKGEFIFNQSKTDTYKISAKFPVQYATNEKYEGIIDHVSIVLDAKQKIN